MQRTAAINSDGIGLGLLIVKQIVEKGSGYVVVKSAGPGKGTTFAFSMRMPYVSELNTLQTIDQNSSLTNELLSPSMVKNEIR